MGDNITDINEAARERAVEASKPGNFNFLDRLVGRNYPTEEVVVYIDEAEGYEIEKIEKLLSISKDPGKRERLEAALAEHRAKAEPSRFVFHLQGISTEEYDSLVDAAEEAYPYEYREGRNPLTFEPERTVIESTERDTFFRTALWAKFIRKVEDPDGNVDDNITPAWVARVSGLLPVMASLKIAKAVEALRMTTDWMDKIQGEDFLAKS